MGNWQATIAETASKAALHYKAVLNAKAVSIFTPFATREALSTSDLSPAVLDFIKRYEPAAAKEGLYSHQATLLKRYRSGAGPNFILTSATGSGKSLCFWAWVMDHLLKEPASTALLCFPTQALMWGQAERLARISDEDSLTPAGASLAFGGELTVAGRKLGWTIWKGVGQGATADREMIRHQAMDAFRRARIRIATLDKAHYSLLRDYEFTKNLSCVVIDEAHRYDGIFGANVHFFLKRICVALELRNAQRPDMFLASATLSDPTAFGCKLLSLDNKNRLFHVSDTVMQQIDEIDTAKIATALAKRRNNGLFRLVILLDQDKGTVDTESFLDQRQIGAKLNALYFVDSKFFGRRLRYRLSSKKGINGRKALTYDADIPPKERRKIEADFNSGKITGTTVIATNALELGIDLEGLDVCVIDRVPPARQDLLQRIGRVGRRKERPGLVVLRASLAPQDRRLLAEPTKAFRLDSVSPLYLPIEIDMLKWRHIAAAYNEGIYRNYADKDWNLFKGMMTKYFGECPSLSELKKRLDEMYGSVMDMGGGTFWAHNGFRASASQGRIPLIELARFENSKPKGATENGHRRDIAWIEDTSVFRDAHPEAIFLDHMAGRWRIVAYDGDWKEAQNVPGGKDIALAKWLKTITTIYVERVREHVRTMGEWEDTHVLYERISDLPSAASLPTSGTLEYGVWDFERKWKGYKLVDLRSGKVLKWVTLADVAKRFAQAKDTGDHFPFLHALTYRTIGWRWNFDEINCSETGLAVAGGLVSAFLTSQLECNASNVQIELDGRSLSFFETNPGGNGLAQVALCDNMLVTAIRQCEKTLRDLKKRGSKKFSEYIETLLDIPTVGMDAAEVEGVLNSLHKYWHGQVPRNAPR